MDFFKFRSAEGDRPFNITTGNVFSLTLKTKIKGRLEANVLSLKKFLTFYGLLMDNLI